MISHKERDFRKIFTGNTAYYLDIERHRARTFLQRNLSSVLAYHGRLERTRQSLDPTAKTIMKAGQIRNDSAHVRRPRWSVEELCKGLRDGSIRPQQAILKVEPKTLRKRSASASASTSGSLADPPNKRIKQPDIRCYCGLTVWGPRSPESDPLVKKSQECTVKTAIMPTGEVIAQIEMDEPLLVNADELFVSVQTSTYSKMTISDSYYMEIMLLPLDSREVWPTILVKPVKGRLSPQLDSMVADHVRNDQVLVAKWTKLPKCPPKGTLLSMQAFKNRKPYKANISLEVDAAWSQLRTPLESYNSRLRLSPADRFPTPVSEPEARGSTVKPAVTVVWTFGNMHPDEKRTVTLTGYLCPACQRRDFVNFELLQFHLITGHDLFKFQISADPTPLHHLLLERTNNIDRRTEPQTIKSARNTTLRADHPIFFDCDGRKFSSSTAGIMDTDLIDYELGFNIRQENEASTLQEVVRINVTVANDYRNKAANHVKDDREFCWQKRKSAFDLKSFLTGDEGWTGKSERSRSTAIPQQNLNTSKSQSQDPSPWALGDPSTVLNLPSANRKKLPVPAAPSEITFFRASSKRPLEEDEPIRESDDDVDESWFWHKHEELIESFSNVPESEKRFMKQYDTYMLKGDVSGNIQFADTLVRFCREHKAWLEEPTMFKEFVKNAAGLISQDSISELVLQGCIRTIRGTNRPIGITKSNRRVRRRRTMDSDYEEAVNPQIAHGDVDMPDADEASFKSPPENQAPTVGYKGGTSYTACGCGEKIRDLSAVIICADLDCSVPMHHIRCVGLQNMIPGWLCRTCSLKKDDAMVAAR